MNAPACYIRIADQYVSVRRTNPTEILHLVAEVETICPRPNVVGSRSDCQEKGRPEGETDEDDESYEIEQIYMKEGRSGYFKSDAVWAFFSVVIFDSTGRGHARPYTCGFCERESAPGLRQMF